MRLYRRLAPSSRKRNAYTLTEVTIVMGIAGLILSGIWSVGSSVRTNMQIAQTVEDLGILTQNIRYFFRTQNEFHMSSGTKLNDLIIKADLLPSGMQGTSSQPKTIWGTNIDVYVTANSDEFRIEFDDELDEEICRGLVGRIAGAGRADGLTKLKAGSTTASDADEFDAISPVSISGTCDSAEFTFSLSGQNK